MGRFVRCTSVVLFAALCPANILAQNGDATVSANVYADAGIGLYGGLGKSNPNYDVDAGTDVSYQKLFVELEAGADTANASGTSDGYNIRTHVLAFYRKTDRWSFGGGMHYAEFKSKAYTKHDFWPTLAVLYDRKWLRLNSQYLLPGSNSDYHETGPLLDLRLRLTHGFYYRDRFALLHYTNELQSPPQVHWGREATFGILYVFPEKQ
jgi:hypothetical protein